MKLLLLAGFAYTSLGMQCIAKQTKDDSTCKVLGQTDCGSNSDCSWIGCTENPNGSSCLTDTTCYWTGQSCVDDSGCGAAPSKGKCNLKTDSDGYPCGFDSDAGSCQRRTCAHSGGSHGWCLKFNGGTGPQCMFLSQQCWDLPSGETAKTTDANPGLNLSGAKCTSTRASKRVACTLLNETDCEADATMQCTWVADSGTGGGGGATPGKCDVSGNNQVKARKCNRKKMCKLSGNDCVEKTCDDFAKNQFTCHFKAKKINLSCVMDGAPCRPGDFTDADMIAKACSTSNMMRVCHAQVKDDGTPRCEWNDDDGVCRDAQNKTCADSNRKECRQLKNATLGEGCWWLGPELRCLDKTTADCTILPRNRCKKVKKFKTHFNLNCSLNRDTGACYNGQVTCGDLTTGLNCVEHANCSWNGTTCGNYGDNPVTANPSDTCGNFKNKKTCREWENNCYWSAGGSLCYVQPGATMP